jgi:ribosomal protein S18 acetylase RimI-like enzyme
MALGERSVTQGALPSVRLLAPDGIEAFKRIRLEALLVEPEAFASVYEDWKWLSDHEWRDKFSGAIFVAFLDEAPVGMMRLSRMLPRKMSHRSMLTSVYVRESCRRMGVASRLLWEAVDFAKASGVRQIELTVSSRSHAAIHFYGRKGFVVRGQISRGFTDGPLDSDEIIMALALDD